MKILELGYKMQPPPAGTFYQDDLVVILDFSFKPEDMAVIRSKAGKVIWCDHHVSAKDYNYDVPGLRDFTDKGRAGCEVTWDFFFPNTPRPAFVTLLGDYDSWRLQQQPECFQFYEGLKLSDQSPLSPLWAHLFEWKEPAMKEIIHQGIIALQYRDLYCAELRRYFGYETEIDGHRAYALNVARFGSQAFAEKFKEYPICTMFIHDGDKFTVSLYSETVDVSLIAKKYGGGGHRGASGFCCEVLPFTAKP